MSRSILNCQSSATEIRGAMNGKPATKPRVAFVCTHNACRSQMAEAIAHEIAGDIIDPCSAGTDPIAAVNTDALRTLRGLYGIDGAKLRPKTLSEIGPVDIVVTMGCGVRCPVLPCVHREDWGLADPTGLGETAFEETAQAIERRVLDLARRITYGDLTKAVQ